MKNLITSMACLMLLLVFVLQFTQNQILYNRITAVDQEINCFKEVAKQEGCISIKNEQNLKEKLCRIVKCKETDVNISGDRVPLFRGTSIHYIVRIPIEGIITAWRFWGIEEKDTKMDYVTDRYTTSEYIGR